MTSYMKLPTRDGPALDDAVRYWGGRKSLRTFFPACLLGVAFANLAQELGLFIAIKLKNFPCTW